MNMPNSEKKFEPLILVILDGWGITGPTKGNAITLAKTPVMDRLMGKYPNTRICAHGKCVGLADGQDGNSEAGHLNIGAGRIVEQDAVRISKSIEDGTFYKNPAFKEAIHNVKKNNSKLHLIGLLSNGMSAHSDPSHLSALFKLLKNDSVGEVYLHLFTDGRDSPRYAAIRLIEDLEKEFMNGEMVATVMGRYFGMDRKKDWVNTEKAYDALVMGKARVAVSARDAILEAYNRGENDEYIEPYVIAKKGTISPRVSNKDSVIFFNLRSDRARQLAKVFVQKNFCEMNQGCFTPKKILKNIIFVGMTDFGPDLDSMLVAFPSADVKNSLPMLLKDLRQQYIAETEKYAHVTYFFNGGYQGKVAGEDQFMVPSPSVKSYDDTPAMSSELLSRAVIENVRLQKYDFTVLNFAAPDMIGHTGNLAAGIKCCNRVDLELGKIVDEYLKSNGTVVITADHGNIEEMINLETGEIDTEHSVNPVPFIIASNKKKNMILDSGGVLGDIAPTILDLLGRDKPEEMTGKSLIKKKNK
jgi:2,3-bisphosphoglycerate-independent phosphoglycerate mutase